MTQSSWPDPLSPPDARRVQTLLAEFWRRLHSLPDLVNRNEHLLAEACTSHLRDAVIEMMLAANGIQWPMDTLHLSSYLGESQRAVLHRTLLATDLSRETWIGRAVALVVIYRWYAPQLVDKFRLAYPDADEDAAWAHLQRNLPEWPATVTTQ